MLNKYCSACNAAVMPKMLRCPKCGSNQFHSSHAQREDMENARRERAAATGADSSRTRSKNTFAAVGNRVLGEHILVKQLMVYWHRWAIVFVVLATALVFGGPWFFNREAAKCGESHIQALFPQMFIEAAKAAGGDGSAYLTNISTTLFRETKVYEKEIKKRHCAMELRAVINTTTPGLPLALFAMFMIPNFNASDNSFVVQRHYVIQLVNKTDLVSFVD